MKPKKYFFCAGMAKNGQVKWQQTLAAQKAQNSGMDHREIGEIRENRVAFVRVVRVVRGKKAPLLDILSILAENKWKCLSMNNLHAKPSFASQSQSSLIKPNQVIIWTLTMNSDPNLGFRLRAHLDTAPGATPRLDPFGVPPSGGPGCLVPGSRVNAGLQSEAVSRCALRLLSASRKCLSVFNGKNPNLAAH